MSPMRPGVALHLDAMVAYFGLLHTCITNAILSRAAATVVQSHVDTQMISMTEAGRCFDSEPLCYRCSHFYCLRA